MIIRSDAACFVGIDLHKDTLTACTIAAKDREVSYRKIACVAREKVREFLAGLPRPSVVAIETVDFYRWLWTEAEPVVDQVLLADVRGARALAGRRIKTDREDAFNVAELLMTGRLPLAWAPPGQIQRLRDLTRHRNGLSRDHARVLHRVKSIMNRLNRPGPARMDAAGLQRYLIASVERIENPTPWAAGGRVPLRLWQGLRSTRPPAPEEVCDAEVTPRLTNPYIVKSAPAAQAGRDVHVVHGSRSTTNSKVRLPRATFAVSGVVSSLR